jgi:hypothetical protein
VLGDASNSLYFSKWYAGNSYYYPLILPGKDGAEVLELDSNGNSVQLVYGDAFQIRVINTAGWETGFLSYDLLGTFNDGVYYWNDFGDQSLWGVESADGKATGAPVYFGDRIRLQNKYYSQHLSRQSGENFPTTTTARDDSSIWLIAKP